MIKNSIEEDIKILEELRIANENCIKNAKNKDNPFVTIWKKQNRALEHILSAYERVLKENEEYSKQLDLDYVDKNYIPIQKVKDEKEKLDKKYNELVDKVYKDPLKALTDFQRVVGGQAILNALLKEGET